MRGETCAWGSALGNSLVSPGERDALDLIIGPFYEKIGFTIFSNGSLHRHVLAA
jgi:hypothetical protein